MKTNKKRILSLLLSTVLVMSYSMPPGISAESLEGGIVDLTDDMLPVIDAESDGGLILGEESDVELNNEEAADITTADEAAGTDSLIIESSDADEDYDFSDIELFEPGYVSVPAGTLLYASPEDIEEEGVFEYDSVAYAAYAAAAEDGTRLWVAFDTENARKDNVPVPGGYVLKSDVRMLTPEEIEGLNLADPELRCYEDIPVVAAYYNSIAEEILDAADEAGLIEEQALAGDAEGAVEEEPDAAETQEELVTEGVPVEEPTEETVEEPAEETVEGPAEEPVEEEVRTEELSAEEPGTEEPSAEPEAVMLRSFSLTAGSGGVNIIAQPVDTEAAVGTMVTFTVEASGVSSYQWKYTSNGTNWYNTSAAGNKTASLTLEATASRYNMQYRCVLTGADGTKTNTDIVRIIKPFGILTQPEDVEAEIGETVTFSVEASGAAAYQWRYSSDGGNKWYKSPAAGNNTAEITVTASESRYALLYRCDVTGEDGTVIHSNAVRMLEPQTVTIVTQPTDVEAAIGENVTFSVEATGVVSYQWKYSYDGNKWYKSPATGSTTAEVTLQASASRYNNLYCCELKGRDGSILTTNAVRIIEPFKIITQPEDVEAEIGEMVTFSVEAVGAVSYQWKYSTDGGTKWYKSPATGNNEAAVTIQASAARYNYLYHCEIKGKDGSVLTTDAVKMIEPVTLVIITQPQDVEANIGEMVSFTVEARGVASYQWKYSYDGNKWYKSPATGNKEATVTLEASASRYNNLYCCELTGKDGSKVTTNAVRMIEPFEIVTQPTDAECEIGDMITFEVEATGVASYQWQYTSNGTKWYNATAATNKEPVLELEVTTGRTALQYHCVLTGKDGTKKTTDSVRMIADFFTVGDVKYQIIDSSTVRVYSYSGSAASLTIPEYPKTGYQVIEIGAEAFMDNAVLQSIDLPDSIVVIGARAFKNCSNLSTMT